MNSWANQQGEGYVSRSHSLPCPKQELLASQNRGDKQQLPGFCFFKPPEVVCSPEQRCLGKRHPWEGSSQECSMSRHGGGSRTISWPSPCCSSPALQRGTLQLQQQPDNLLAPCTHSQREEHHFWRLMGLVHGSESWFSLLSSATSLHSVKVIY